MHPLIKSGVAAALALACGASLASSPAVAPAPHAQSPAVTRSQASYSLGVSLGAMLRGASLDEQSVSTARLMAGLRAALAGKARLTPADQQRIHSLLIGARMHEAASNHAAAAAFLARNRKKQGVVTTPSGLEYLVLRSGKGTSPEQGDVVTVNYRGTLLNGTVFDSSYQRGQPATFPVNGVIPGFREALLRMKPGAKWRIFIPPQLAYDMNSRPPIPPGSMLIFDVELLSVEHHPAAPAAPPAPPQPH